MSSYLVGYTYVLKSTPLYRAPQTKYRYFATEQEAKSYAEAVKAHALANPDVISVRLYINAPLPEHVYVAPGAYMPGPTIHELHICNGKVIAN